MVERVEVMDRLEHAMIAAHGIPVNVAWSFRLSMLVCERRDGRELTVEQLRTWEQVHGARVDEDVRFLIAKIADAEIRRRS